MSKFLRICNQVESFYAIVVRGNRNRRMWSSVQISHNARLAINVSHSKLKPMRNELAEYIGSSCHIRCTTNRLWRAECFSAAVGIEHDIFGQHRKQPLHVAGLRSVQELLEKVALLFPRGLEPRPQSANVLARAAQDLPAIYFRLPQNGADFFILILKDFPQQKYRALSRCESFKQYQKSHGQRLIHANESERVGACVR